MKNKTISISDDLFDKCKTINASSLINELLRNHFNMGGEKEDLEKQLADIEYKKKYQFEILEKQKEELEKTLSLKEREEHEQEEFKRKEKEREERQEKYDEENKPLPKFDVKAYAAENKTKIRESVNRGFKHFMGRDMLQNEYDEYMKDYWAEGRPMTEFIEIVIKNQKPNEQNTEAGQAEIQQS